MNNFTSNSEAKGPTVSAIPYALLVPLLAVLVHDAHASMTGWSLRHNIIVAQPIHPVLLVGFAVIAVMSYFVIRPFTKRATSRWVAFLSCVAVFSCLAILLLAKLAE